MNKKRIALLVSLALLSIQGFALEMQCFNESGLVLSLRGDNSSAQDLVSGVPIVGDLAFAYHIAIDVEGVIAGVQNQISFTDSLIMLRRGRAIHTSNDGISLYWDSTIEKYRGAIGSFEGEFDCSLEGL